MMRATTTTGAVCAKLLWACATAAPAFERVPGMPFFEFLQRNPREGAGVRRVDGEHLARAEKLPRSRVASTAFEQADAPRSTRQRRNGHLLSTRPSSARSALRPAAGGGGRARARLRQARRGVRDRIEVAGGDFFASVPSDADGYLMKYILHDWDDAQLVAILRLCRDAMAPAGRVLVADHVIPPGNGPHRGKLMDLNMFVLLTGKERTKAEFAELFATAGLDCGASCRRGSLSVLEGVRAYRRAPREDPVEFETIRVPRTGPMGELVLARPERLNALSAKAMREIAAAARWFDEQRDVRVGGRARRGPLVLRGRGSARLAGRPRRRPARGRSWAERREVGQLGLRMADAVEQMRAVTVAQVHGHAVGGGVVLMAACDLRVVADDTVLSIPEIDLGIPLAWGGIPRLVREIGPALTKELVMTCRRFTPEEARAAGFVNRVVPAARVAAEARGAGARSSRRSRPCR